MANNNGTTYSIDPKIAAKLSALGMGLNAPAGIAGMFNTTQPAGQTSVDIAPSAQ